MTAPRVSIVMPVYNGRQFLAEAIRSLQEEPGIDAEIVVVDDGSTDGSVDIVAGLADDDARIRPLHGPHVGVAAARNVGLRACTAPYVTFLDCDDICPKGRIARQVGKLEAAPELECVIGETLIFEALDGNQQPVAGSRSERMLCVHLHSATFRAGVFESYGYFDEALELAEDLDLFFRLSEAGAQMLIEPDIASLYRRHGSNMTRDTSGARRDILKVLQRSMARRRASGRSEPLDLFFTRRFSAEIRFGRSGAL